MMISSGKYPKLIRKIRAKFKISRKLIETTRDRDYSKSVLAMVMFETKRYVLYERYTMLLAGFCIV